MAWTEQCKIDACAQIERRKEMVGGTRKAMRELAKESGIPYNTLKYWFYGVVKNHHTQPPKKPVKSQFSTCRVSDLQWLVDNGHRFGAIYADPPWKYQNQGTRSCTDDHYDTMTVEEIASLPISELSLDRAHLHLWVTAGFLPEAFKIIEAWGFEYKSYFAWIKEQMGIGNYWRKSSEIMLLGVKGNIRFADHSQKDWILTNRTSHSQKPDQVRKIIETVSPGPYLELFARTEHPNWTVWGNEIERTIFQAQVLNDNKQ